MTAQRDRNVELAREGIQAFDRGDREAVLQILDPEIETHVAPGLVNTGTWHGLDGYREMITAWEEAWENLSFDRIDVEPVDDRHVLAHVHQSGVGRGSGVPVEMDVAFLFEIVNGRARRFQIHPDRESALAAI